MLAWAKDLAQRDETVAGYPDEYGGHDDLGGYVSGFETLAFGDLSLLVKVGVQFGLFGGAVLHLGTEGHHERYLRRHRLAGAAGLLRDDRGGPRLQRPGAAHDRHLRRRDGEFVVHTPDDCARTRRGSATPRATAGWRPCSPS